MPEETIKHLNEYSPDTEAEAQKERAKAKRFDNLLEVDPYPLLHYTQPSTAARVMVEGIASIAASKEAGRHIRNGNNWQGEGQISVTDIEGYVREHESQEVSRENRSDIIREALSMEKRDVGPAGFWNGGGVCLLINPNLDRYYGGQTNHIPRDQADEKLLGIGQEGDNVRYGGGYPGEAVVPGKIEPHDIYGVVLTSHFKDRDLSDAFSDKVASLEIDTPNDYFHKFNDEVNLLELFKMLDDEKRGKIEQMRIQYEKAQKLHTTLYAPDSFTNMIKRTAPDMVTQDMLELEATQKKELEEILNNPELRQCATDLLEDSKNLINTLKDEGISTYSDLITFLAKSQGIPVYNKEGKVIWPNDGV